MWEWKLELHLDSHNATACHVFDDDVQAFREHSFTNTNFQNDLRVDFVLDLARSKIGDIVWCEAELPVHKHGVVLGLWVSLDVFEARRLGAESEELHAHAVQERRGAGRQNLVY